MIDPKIIFVKKFLATLFNDKVKTFPINNDDFKSGIEKMAVYYRQHKDNFGSYTESLEFLFMKYTTRGDFMQFAKIIESFNGRIVSLENPHYIKANIKMEQEYVDELIANTYLGIENQEFCELVNCFRIGAKI